MGCDSEADRYQRARQRIRDGARTAGGRFGPWVELVFLPADLIHVLCRLSADPEVPRGAKVRLALALAYFISPIDLVPEALFGPIGYLDDVALALHALQGLIDASPPGALSRHWAGGAELPAVLRRVLGVAHGMLGGRLRRRPQRRVL
ncbi:MAG: YkvA family protein [Deferrisomatales bacterium]